MQQIVFILFRYLISWKIFFVSTVARTFHERHRHVCKTCAKTEQGTDRDDIELPFHSCYGTESGVAGPDDSHVGYKMKFPLLDAYPREHKIEVHRGGWDTV